MNELIETTLANFTVGGVSIPVRLLFYEGHGEPYVVYGNTDKDTVIAADDYIENYADYYDFDVYSQGNIMGIVEELISKLEAVGFLWQPSRSGPMMYEPDTRYFHQTISLVYMRGIN